MTTIELELTETEIDVLNHIGEKTGLSLDKVVEYIVANMIIKNVMKDYNHGRVA